MRFSEKKGLKKNKIDLMKEGLDNYMRIGLWNVFLTTIWNPEVKRYGMKRDILTFSKIIWDIYFKLPIDTIPNNISDMFNLLKTKYLDVFKWYELLDFLELVSIHFPSSEYKLYFIRGCNNVFKRELSVYRLVQGAILELTAEEQLIEVESVLSLKSELEPVKRHIITAIDLLKNRENPNYRNSIKESISAVEAMGRIIMKKPKSKLSSVLKVIDSKIRIHPAFKIALEKLYSYTSDESGIRHSLIEEDELDLEDANFMLVVCSAFVNYLNEKSIKAGIKF